MKQSSCGNLEVFDFKEEDELVDEVSLKWRTKFSDPNTKYQFLECAARGSVIQSKATVNAEYVDVEEHSILHATSDSPLGISIENGSCKHSVESDIISETTFERCCQFGEDNLHAKSFFTGIEMRVATPAESSPANVNFSSNILELRNIGSMDAAVSDGSDSIKESSPSTLPMAENNGSIDNQAQGPSFSGSELEDMNTIVLHTDYIAYRGEYWPDSQINFSDNSVKVEASSIEQGCETHRLDWKIDDILNIESHWMMDKTAKLKLQLLTKDAAQGGNAHAPSGVEELEFVVCDPDWPQRQERIMSLDKRYKAVWCIVLSTEKEAYGVASPESSESSSGHFIPNFDEPFEDVVYPKGDVDAVSISKKDVELLEPETFINDTIIDFYIKYLKNIILPGERHRFHFFNSFFFRKLADPDKTSPGDFDAKAAFQRVRKWTRKVDFFQKDYIFIPVNYNLHWSLIIICHPGEVATFKDEDMNETSKVPYILHMDSIRGSHTGLKGIVQSYLFEEWKEREKEASEDISSKFLNLRFVSPELPQQENCFDCGLFLLHYVELFVAQVPVNFNPLRISKDSTFLTEDWFIPGEASLKRSYIQRLIYELLEKHSPECASSSCSDDVQNNENDVGVEFISERSSPRKPCSGNSLCLPMAQGIEMDLLGPSSYRTSFCVNESGLASREFLDQGVLSGSFFGQYHARGPSSGQLQGTMSPIDIYGKTDVDIHSFSVQEGDEADEHISHSPFSASRFEQLHELPSEPCNIQSRASAAADGPWNLAFSEQGEHEDNSSTRSDSPSDDSVETTMIESDSNIQRASSDQNGNLDQANFSWNENDDSLPESFASASSDMMATPAEDSQPLDQIQTGNDQESLDPDPHVNEESNRSDNYASDSDVETDIGHVAKKARILVEDEREDDQQ